MQATDVIEMYINETVRLLPRRQREDVATELHSLLDEELHALAKKSGRPLDESLALELVRGFGSPNEAAARYQPPWTIIDPADSTSFLKAAILGACALIVLGVLGKRQPSPPQIAAGMVKVAILTWFGLLVVVFGMKSWMRRRWPALARWKPHDRDRVNRLGTAVAMPLAAFCVILYGAPIWMLYQLSGGHFNTSWAAYTADFQKLRLPCFLALMFGLIALRSFVAVQGRWVRLTRRVEIGLNLAVVGLILSLAVDGNVFQSSVADKIAQNVLAMVAAIYLPGVALMIYGEIGRIDRPVPTAKAF